MPGSHPIDPDLIVVQYSLATMHFKSASGDSNIQPKLRTTEVEEILAYCSLKNLSESERVL